MNWLFYVLAALAGAANPVQSGANAELRRVLDKPFWASVVVYGTGLLGVFLLLVFMRETLPTEGRWENVPWWAWTGGLLSIASTIAGLMLAQQLGSGVFTGITVTASVLISILLDHYGLIGFEPHLASPLRLVGGGLMVIGIWLVAKN